MTKKELIRLLETQYKISQWILLEMPLVELKYLLIKLNSIKG